MLVGTAALSGAILLIIGAATGMAWSLTQSGFSAIAGLRHGQPSWRCATFLAVSIVTFIILGSVLEGIPAIVLFGPLLFPIARQIGVHEVHYSMVVTLAMGIGLFAPPFRGWLLCGLCDQRHPPGSGHAGLSWATWLPADRGLDLVAAVPWFSIGFL